MRPIPDLHAVRRLLTTLFAEHGRDVRRALQRRAIGEADVDELFQTVFLLAWESAKRREMPTDMETAKGWLMGAAIKLAANYRRLHRHQHEVHDIALINRIPDPIDLAECAQLRDLIVHTTSELASIDKHVLIMHAVEGKTLSEIAAWLGMGKSGAHVRLTHARAGFSGVWRRHERKGGS